MKELERRQVVITVSGTDSPGITAALTSLLAEARVTLLDIEQVVVRDQLLLAFLVEFPESSSEGKNVLKNLLFKAKELDLELDFKVLDPKRTTRTLHRPRIVVTLLARRLGAGGIAGVATVLSRHGVNIETIHKLSQRDLFCVELKAVPPAIRGEAGLEELLARLKHDLLQAASREEEIDVSFQVDDLYRRAKRLVVLDMDSTLIQGEMIDEMARRHGVFDRVAELTESAMRGKIDFEESLRRRVAQLKGMPLSVLEELVANLELNEGAEILVRVLKRLGYKIAVISGGFRPFAESLKHRLDLNYAYANNLELRDGRLTGRLAGPVVTPQRKADLMEVIAQEEGILLQQVIAIGDGANDLLMLERAGMGIAYHAKPVVRRKAQHAISQRGLDSVLYLLGISERDIQTILQESSSTLAAAPAS